MRKNKKLILIFTVILAVALIISTTFAWLTAEDKVVNRLETTLITDGSVVIREVFDPPTEWKPGQTITKQVAVANDGSGSVLVRVKFSENMSILQLPAKDSTTVTSSPKVPQFIDTAAYSGYGTATAAGLTTVNGQPANTTLLVKKVMTDSLPSYSCVLYYPITSGEFNGKSQRMTADFKVTGGDTLTITNVKYWAFDGRDESAAAWTTNKPAATAIDHPITDDEELITIAYTNETDLTAAAPKAGEWWYNPTDGYFYYIGLVTPQMITKNLMDSLTLDEDGGEAYTGIIFDLTIEMEAIQNTEEAIKASDGWNLTGDNTILTALTPFCE